MNNNWKDYRYITEFMVDVNFKKYNSDIHIRELEIIHEDEKSIMARQNFGIRATKIYKGNTAWADFENLLNVTKIIKETIETNFDVNKFDFKVFILSKNKVKEKRLRHILTSIVKIEINNIRTKGLKKK